MDSYLNSALSGYVCFYFFFNTQKNESRVTRRRTLPGIKSVWLNSQWRRKRGDPGVPRGRGNTDTNLSKENLDRWVPPSVEKRDGAEAKRISWQFGEEPVLFPMPGSQLSFCCLRRQQAHIMKLPSQTTLESFGTAAYGCYSVGIMLAKGVPSLGFDSHVSCPW